MSAWRSIQTAGELLDYPDGGRLAFCPTGEMTVKNEALHGVDLYELTSARLHGEVVVLVIDGRNWKYRPSYLWPTPVYIEVEVEAAETMTTYRRADGELVGGDYGWVADLEWFEEDEWGLEGVKVVKEVWTLTVTEEIHLHPEECWSCEKPWHAETCNEEPEEN